MLNRSPGDRLTVTDGTNDRRKEGERERERERERDINSYINIVMGNERDSVLWLNF